MNILRYATVILAFVFITPATAQEQTLSEREILTLIVAEGFSVPAVISGYCIQNSEDHLVKAEANEVFKRAKYLFMLFNRPNSVSDDFKQDVADVMEVYNEELLKMVFAHERSGKPTICNLKNFEAINNDMTTLARLFLDSA